MNELTTSIYILTSEALDVAQTLRDEIFQHRLNSNLRMAYYFETFHHNNFPIRQDVIEWTHTEHTGDVLREHYRHVSFLLAFLELTKESSTSSSYSSDGVLQHVNNLEEKLYELLCHMMTTLNNLNVRVGSHVTRSEIPEQLREITSVAVINSRDFIIAKDAVHFLSGLKESHSLMRSGYQ
ncbi:uncharacterized protein LOC124253656 [Haliotis rubra]|uniref:uncharacterized protein LOC124253656 n=1 Tax=Haliotis rubra TaxID=36100 RepID=UPI001EE5D46C|nr:uncharacterized protein LOC124253656 [Haliotis rubra]